MKFVEKVARRSDRLFGCNQSFCRERRLIHVTQSKDISPGNLGTAGRPRVRTRQTAEAAKDKNDGGPPSGGEFILAISPEKTSGTDWAKHSDEFFNKMKSMEGVRLPGERRHKNRLDKGPRNINEELVNKIKSLS